MIRLMVYCVLMLCGSGIAGAVMCMIGDVRVGLGNVVFPLKLLLVRLGDLCALV